ncbi:MAG: ABC transporter ATP-binding protein [Bacillota bacterium]|nr:ABC transporter ATP-binding protein [Bacillota bacterium]
MEDNLIVAKSLSKEYGNSGGVKTLALDKVDFSIKRGSLCVILGPSGAGKTTLLNLLGGMDALTSGNLYIDGEDLAKYSLRDLTKFRREKVGFVFQFYNLMPNLTALENVELAVEVCPNHLDPFESLKEVGLEDKKDNFPTQLSGGQQQRVSIARAVAKNPLILLCDEPTGALDGTTGKGILKVLQERATRDKITVIIVTHNAIIKDIADQVIYIKNGKIEKIEYHDSPLPIEKLEL